MAKEPFGEDRLMSDSMVEALASAFLQNALYLPLVILFCKVDVTVSEQGLSQSS